MKLAVFVYLPNLIGYARLILICFCWGFFDNFFVCLPLYLLSAFLDGIDGCLARRLGQTSALGAWLDVLVDNIGRTLMWTRLYQWGVFIVCLEWTVFVCTHTHGSVWKQAFGAAPWWVKQVMENGFYSFTGTFAVAGIHGLPIYLYFWQHYPKSWTFLNRIHVLLVVPIVVLGVARLLGLLVEIWCVKTHIMHLVSSEEDRTLQTLTRDLGKPERGGSQTPSS